MLGAGRLALAAADAVAGLFGIGEVGFPLVLDGLGLAEHPQLVPDAEVVRDVHPHGAGHTVPAAGAADLDAAVQEGGGLLHRGGLCSGQRLKAGKGALKQVMSYDLSILAGITARIKIIGGMDIAEKRKPQDGRITIMVDRREFDVRVSILPKVFGEKTVMRLTSKDGLTKPKSALGFDAEQEKVFMITYL